MFSCCWSSLAVTCCDHQNLFLNFLNNPSATTFSTCTILAVCVAITTGSRRCRHGVSVGKVGAAGSHLASGVFCAIRRSFTRPSARLVVQQPDEEVNVLHGQSQDLVFAEFFVRWVSRDEFAKFRKSSVYVLLPPAFSTISENTASQLLWRTFIEIQFKVCRRPSLHTSATEDPKASRRSKKRTVDERVRL